MKGEQLHRRPVAGCDAVADIAAGGDEPLRREALVRIRILTG